MKIKPNSGMTSLPYQNPKAVGRQGCVQALLTIDSL